MFVNTLFPITTSQWLQYPQTPLQILGIYTKSIEEDYISLTENMTDFTNIANNKQHRHGLWWENMLLWKICYIPVKRVKQGQFCVCVCVCILLIEFKHPHENKRRITHRIAEDTNQDSFTQFCMFVCVQANHCVRVITRLSFRLSTHCCVMQTKTCSKCVNLKICVDTYASFL